MKAKKALKRLNKVEVMISAVIDGYPTAGRRVKELLDSARSSVVNAKDAVNLTAAPKAAKTPPAKAVATKRKGAQAASGRSQRKTA